MESKRLNKYISDTGFCSRREADKLMEQGRVTVNGKIPEAGAKVTPKDKVRIDDEILHVKEEEFVFLAFNKPAGIATTTDLSVKNNITSALNYPANLIPIGHLDRDAEGLIFLSNDTELARKMTKSDTRYEKEYVVTVDKQITPDFLSKISEGGAPVPGVARKKSFVSKEGANRFRIVLEPNTNHHVKRMVEFLDYKVINLQRIRIQHITLAKLPVRFWRKLTEPEITILKNSIAGKGSYSQAEGRLTERTSARSRTSNPAGSPKSVINPKSAAARSGNKKTNTAKASASRNTPPNAASSRNSKSRK